jgi:hypothetical protein
MMRHDSPILAGDD